MGRRDEMTGTASPESCHSAMPAKPLRAGIEARAAQGLNEATDAAKIHVKSAP
jgi:hypothetical protein